MARLWFKKNFELKTRVLTMKSWVPCTYLSIVVQKEKLVACGTQMLLEHSPWRPRNLTDDQNNAETGLLEDLRLHLTEKKFLTNFVVFPAFWPLFIHLELVENRERFSAFFWDNIVIFVRHFEWCKEWNDCRLTFHFVNRSCSPIYLHLWKTGCMIASAGRSYRNVAFSNAFW